MDSGGWPTAGPRHGRHRRGYVNSAWTPVVRPTEAGHLPTHARFPWGPSPEGDTAPILLLPHQSESDDVVVHSVPEPRGLGKFDLGIVPASVTPPRSWRKAAWFAVGTSAAVVCGLAVAAVRLVGTPPTSGIIDALPAFPTQEELGTLPLDEKTRASVPPSSRSSSPSPTSSRPESTRHPQDPTRPDPSGPTTSGSPAASTTSGQTVWSEPIPPPRTTVGPEPVTPTSPEAMGDRTELYFVLVTEDPKAAHDMCAGAMAREGPDGIRARYAGVDHVEVQDMTIDRNEAMTTSTVKIVHEDGTETMEQRRLTFTWGGDPKISGDKPAG